MTVGDANASDRRGLGGRGLSAVEVATAAPAAAAGRTLAPWPDANRVAHESIREQTKQGGTGRAREAAKLPLRDTTADLRLHGKKGLERLRA
jgi:hypothetical protein